MPTIDYAKLPPMVPVGGSASIPFSLNDNLGLAVRFDPVTGERTLVVLYPSSDGEPDPQCWDPEDPDPTCKHNSVLDMTLIRWIP